MIVVLAVVWAVMRIAGRRAEKPALQRASWIPMAMIVVLLFSQTLVTTKAERLNEALDAMLLSVEDADYDTFRQIVPDDAEAFFPPGRAAQRFTRDGVIDRLEDVKIRALILLSAEPAMIGEDAAVTLIRVRAQGSDAGLGGIQFFEWAITWRYEDDRWQAHRFECTSMGSPFGDQDDNPDDN